jgi:protein TonB
MPSFPGGEKERSSFIANNLRVPAEGIEGTVYITFIVEKDGSITDAKILRGLGKSYDDEVLRVINLMPRWLPGTQNEEAVAVKFNMPVKFEKK